MKFRAKQLEKARGLPNLDQSSYPENLLVLPSICTLPAGKSWKLEGFSQSPSSHARILSLMLQ